MIPTTYFLLILAAAQYGMIERKSTGKTVGKTYGASCVKHGKDVSYIHIFFSFFN
jgi:hypothetical protein